ncbi:MAG: GyrI-like domain-containing protein [Bacteroidia bacterium]
MFLRTENITEKKLLGIKIRTSLTENKTIELWRKFMSRRKEIKNNLNSELISMQVFDDVSYFEKFDPKNKFDKWAVVEVKDLNSVPDQIETFILNEGLYAVFLHKGHPSTGPKTFEYIFGTWLPNSKYILDHRPHFGVMGDKYNNDDPASEEELWVPIRLK